MSITNKLIANIKQTTVDIDKFIDTNNVICIDTSNNRIGINTKTPRYSIDICDNNGKIFVSNLEVTQNARFFTISGNTIKCIDGSFTQNLDTSFINFKTISGSLIRATTTNSTTILGICGNIVDLSGRNIKISNELRALSISADTINTRNFSTVFYDVSEASFNILKIKTTINTQDLIATTISCDILRAKYIISDNIKCNQTLSADIIRTDRLRSANDIPYFTFSGEELVLATRLGASNLATINSTINTAIAANFSGNRDFSFIKVERANIKDCSMTTCLIEDELNIKNIRLDNSNGRLLLPLKNNNNNIANSLAIKNFRYNIGNGSIQNINSLAFYNTNSKWSNIFTATHYATLDLSNISNKNLTSYSVSALSYYKYIPLRFKTINNNSTKTDLFYISPFPNGDKYIEISNIDLSSGIYEINASVTLSYTNTISGDVEPNDFTFGLYDKEVLDPILTNNLNNLNITTTTIDTSYNYVKNKNFIVAFDNSYNYSSVSLHYIGPLFAYNYSNIPSTYRRGICYLVSSQKEISNFNVEYFTSTIKLLNYYDN
jgi:hypothetical protein